MLGNILAIVCMILISGFFSATETAYASAGELRLRHAAEKGGLLSKTAHKIYGRYDQALTTSLVFNNLANNAGTMLATVVVLDLLGAKYAWVSTVAMTLLVLAFAEITPKVLAKQSPEKTATLTALPLRGAMFIASPVVLAVTWLMNRVAKLWNGQMTAGPSVTEDDLEVILDTVEDEGVIDEDTTDLLQSALEFDDVLAFEIITPRVDIEAIDLEDDLEEILQIALHSPYSRLPVCEGGMDNIVGILHLNRLLKRLVDEPEPDLRTLLMPAPFIHKTMPLPDALAVMREQKCHMVIVNDEYGGTMGLLTMEDILEQLVGDIWDESDEIEREFREVSPGRYEADGDMRIHDFFYELDIDDRDFDNDNATLGGWAMDMLDGNAKSGDSFAYKNLIITVERVHKRRVTKLKAELRGSEGGDEE
ncbi:MAG: hemolysin family protein [Oscillospiraceae bacterium]|nr:hemolysin family protein [Oscillospiraceae bacterium]